MNKKKALYTSLAALALAATANTSFAEEVDATVAEPTVAEVPATEEVAQDAPVAEVVAEEPVAEVVTEEASAETAPEVTTRAVEEEVPVTTFAAASAGEQAAPAMDVQAIATGDYSSVEGEWVNEKGETLEIIQAGPVISADHISFVSHYELTGQTGSTLKNISDSSYTEAYDAVLSGEVQGMYPKTVHINYIPQGSSFGWWSGRGSNVETVTATEDWIVWMPSSENALPGLSNILEYRVYKRVVQPVEEVVLTDEAIYADVLSQYKDYISSTNPFENKPQELDASAEAAQGNVNYAFYDIDGDGRNELLITHGYDQDMTVDVFTSIDEQDSTSLRFHAGSGRIYNIYRVNDAGLVQSIFRSETRGVNSVLMEDGTIWTTGRTGTTPTGVTKYQLDATGVYVEVATYADMEQNGNERSGIYTNFATGEQLTLDELLAQINASKAVNLAALTWTAVSDFTRPANAVTGNLTTTANPTKSEVVHVPLTAKTEATVEQATPAKSSYSRSEKTQAEKTAQSEKGILPSTGEVTSVLGVIGAGLSALGLAGLRRRNK